MGTRATKKTSLPEDQACQKRVPLKVCQKKGEQSDSERKSAQREGRWGGEDMQEPEGNLG